MAFMVPTDVRSGKGVHRRGETSGLRGTSIVCIEESRIRHNGGRVAQLFQLRAGVLSGGGWLAGCTLTETEDGAV
jgi:hypothetical protein